MLFDADAWASGEAWRWLARLRAGGPVVRAGDVWAVLGHAEALRVLTDPRTFTSRFGTGRNHVSVPGRSDLDVAPRSTVDARGRSLDLDDPRSTAHCRSLSLEAPRSVDGYGRSLNLDDPPRSTALRRALVLAPPRLDLSVLETFLARGGGDFVADVAQPFALATFGSVVGLHGPLLEELGVLTRALARAADRRDFARADQALLTWLVEHRAAPHPFFQLGAELDPRDQRFLLRLLAQTGHESTAMLLALAVDALLDAGLPFDASPAAVEELIRFTSPLIRFAREATCEVTLGDVRVSPGERVVVVFPLVNRDPRVFSRPDALVLDRPATMNPQLAFGAGPHACFGADLARTMLSAALGALAAGPRLEVVERRVLRSSVTRGLQSLSLRTERTSP